MASIRKSGHRWEVRIRHKNKPTKCKTFTSKADALSWANKTEYLIETEAHTITPPTLSLSGAAARYIDEHMCRHKGAESAGYRLRNIITAIAVPVEAVPNPKSPIMPPALPRAPSFPASTDVSLFCTFGEVCVIAAAIASSVFAVFNLSSAYDGVYIISS